MGEKYKPLDLSDALKKKSLKKYCSEFNIVQQGMWAVGGRGPMPTKGFGVYCFVSKHTEKLPHW